MSDAIVASRELLTAGRTADAVRALEDAGAAGDAQALFEAATLYLVGQQVPRDLPHARTLLRRAVEIGHVDAALMEIAFTGNGSGGTADWPQAVRLLEAAAQKDPLAHQQFEMIRAMNLDRHGLPRALPTPERICATPDIVRFPRLMAPQECAYIASTAGDMLAPAVVVDPRTGRNMQHPIRTSDGAVIGPARENLVIRALNARMAHASGTDIQQGEPLAVLRYSPGQQYREHLDCIAGATNQRIKTALLYLNEGFGGGETLFPVAGVRITPQGGDLLVFTNTLADGSPDPHARHAGLPVTRGTKWLATRWIREKRFDPWNPN